MKKLIILLSILLLNGCSFIKEVKPWKKGDLARPIMQIGGMQPERAKFEGHVYYSKEASKGGAGVAGGGCGCN